MTPQDKYQKIMEVMSDKTLSFGCRIYTKDKDYEGRPIAIVIKPILWTTSWSWYDRVDDCVSVYIDFWWRSNYGKFKPMASFSKNKMEIIWHPLHIWDVLYYIDKNHWICNWEIIWTNQDWDTIFDLWKDKRRPISPTDEELVNYIYNLIWLWKHL